MRFKDWVPLTFKPLQLKRGRTTLTVRALLISGDQVMELKEVCVGRVKL
ncbi:MAG: hypothetical protein QGG71_17595 [Pirellulaceae bacterium]|nr:hypothetical protein [Pirellulaceae bacterium]